MRAKVQAPIPEEVAARALGWEPVEGEMVRVCFPVRGALAQEWRVLRVWKVVRIIADGSWHSVRVEGGQLERRRVYPYLGERDA